LQVLGTALVTNPVIYIQNPSGPLTVGIYPLVAATSLGVYGTTTNIYASLATGYTNSLSVSANTLYLNVSGIISTVTFNAQGGSVSPGTTTATYGATYGALPTPTLAGYTFNGWNTAANGSGATITSGTTVSITSAQTLYAQWTINTYTLTYNAAPGGSISGTTPQTINYGANGSTVTAVPNTGYHFVSWSDGVSTSNRTDVALIGGTNVTANFVINSYNLVASAGANGSISPSGTTGVNYGGSQSYTITPDVNYAVSDVLVDGSSVGAVTTYTFSSVAAAHTISASFVLACSAPGIVGGLDATGTNLCVGSPVILTLTNATGTSPLAYQWQTNGTIILNATNASYTNSSVSDTWNYACVVTNACGSITSSVVTVTVNPSPATTGISGSTTVVHGSTHTYSVTTTIGSTYDWMLPAGATFTGGLSNSISVTFGTTSGNMTVTETNASGCTGTQQNLAVTVAANNAPTANVMNVLRTPGEAVLIALSDIFTNWSDLDGDWVQMTAFNGVTSNAMNLTPLNLTTDGGGYVTTNVAYLGYTNTANVNDQFTYSIGDGYGGTNVGYVNIVVDPFVAGTQTITGQQTTNAISGSSFTVTYYGIPGYTYLLERSTNLTTWVDISTNTIGSGGVTNVIDSFSDLPGVPSSAYYRVGWQPSY